MVIFNEPLYPDVNIPYFRIYCNESENLISGNLAKVGIFTTGKDNSILNGMSYTQANINKVEMNQSILDTDSELIFTKRHKKLIKKGLFIRIFIAIYHSDIKAKDFLLFISKFDPFIYQNSINAFDFTMLPYNKFIAINALGGKEYGVAQYIDIVDIIGADLAYEYGEEFARYFENNLPEDSPLLPFIYRAIEVSKNNEVI